MDPGGEKPSEETGEEEKPSVKETGEEKPSAEEIKAFFLQYHKKRAMMEEEQEEQGEQGEQGEQASGGDLRKAVTSASEPLPQWQPL